MFDSSSLFQWTVVVAAWLVTVACEPKATLLGAYRTDEGGETGAFGGTSGAGGWTGGASSGGSFTTFGSAVLIESLQASGFTTTDPTVTGDGLELFFMSTRSGNKNVWRSRRATLTDAWETPELVKELATDSIESNLKISEDGLTLWFYSDRDRGSGTIWQSTRSTTKGVFSNPVVIGEVLDEGSSEVAACANGARTVALVSSSIDGRTQGYDLLEMRRGSVNVSFGEKRLLANINSEADDFDPWLSADGRLLLFHSNRLGDDDLFWASRPTADDDFGVPRAITELNTVGFAESAPTLTRDHGRLIFSSTRGGDEQLYEAISRE